MKIFVDKNYQIILDDKYLFKEIDSGYICINEGIWKCWDGEIIVKNYNDFNFDMIYSDKSILLKVISEKEVYSGSIIINGLSIDKRDWVTVRFDGLAALIKEKR
jgi:hypothetical protein